MTIYDERADLYDIAFSWDISEEIAWLTERLGGAPVSLLEPACGSGRMLVEFARRGWPVTGLDVSEVMLERARARFRAAGLAGPPLLRADMAEFDLADRFGAAVCPINSFGYLATKEQAAGHLASVARHLEPGATYLLQVDLRDTENYGATTVDAHSTWEMERGGVTVRTTWRGLTLDAESGIEIQSTRFEILSGPETGKVVELESRMRLWSWPGWRDLIATSPLRQVAAFDGGTEGRYPEVALGPELEQSKLTWHELALR